MAAVDTLAYSSTNVTNAAYVTLDASTTVNAASLLIVDTSTQLIKLATGPAGSEVDLCGFDGNGYPILIKQYIPVGTRLSVRAITTTANTGSLVVSLLGY